ncbi:MAG: hypothetical protein A2091_10410 [Desulfuromonadales bacterium GWD2_61_12]|nr:MAG: hypothetical protein A2091_10410 [Desulfuromonadales bacterium GWD2_61_12]
MNAVSGKTRAEPAHFPRGGGKSVDEENAGSGLDMGGRVEEEREVVGIADAVGEGLAEHGVQFHDDASAPE